MLDDQSKYRLDEAGWFMHYIMVRVSIGPPWYRLNGRERCMHYRKIRVGISWMEGVVHVL